MAGWNEKQTYKGVVLLRGLLKAYWQPRPFYTPRIRIFYLFPLVFRFHFPKQEAGHVAI